MVHSLNSHPILEIKECYKPSAPYLRSIESSRSPIETQKIMLSTITDLMNYSSSLEKVVECYESQIRDEKNRLYKY